MAKRCRQGLGGFLKVAPSAHPQLTRVRPARKVSIFKTRLPALIPGVDLPVDRRLLDHFWTHASRIFTLQKDAGNPSKEILLPMALGHEGLMHSLLALSATNLATMDSDREVVERKYHHLQCSISMLRTDENIEAQIQGTPETSIDNAYAAQILILCLQTTCEGDTTGQYRYHLDAARYILQRQRSSNQAFQHFLHEFFIYYEMSNHITCIDRPISGSTAFRLSEHMQPEALGRIFGVVDSVFAAISEIRALRHEIRIRRARGRRSSLDPPLLWTAEGIDAGLRQWDLQAGEQSAEHLFVRRLYHICAKIYLFRTTYPSQGSKVFHALVDSGLDLIRSLPSESATLSVMLMPLFLLAAPPSAVLSDTRSKTPSKSWKGIPGRVTSRRLAKSSTTSGRRWTQKTKTRGTGNPSWWKWATTSSFVESKVSGVPASPSSTSVWLIPGFSRNLAQASP